MTGEEFVLRLLRPLMGDSREMVMFSDTQEVRRFLEKRGLMDLGTIRPLSSEFSRFNEVAAFYSHLNPALGDALRQSPPFVVEVSAEALQRLSKLCGMEAGGLYLTFTNLILVSKSFSDSKASETFPVAQHELAHYAGFLGRGGSVDFTVESKDGKARKVKVGWIEEGLAQHTALRFLRAQPRTLSYPHEVLVFRCIEQFTGADTIAMAHITGDLRPLQHAVDEKFGSGVFERLIQSRNGAEALSYLFSLAPATLSSNPIDLGRLREDKHWDYLEANMRRHSIPTRR